MARPLTHHPSRGQSIGVPLAVFLFTRGAFLALGAAAPHLLTGPRIRGNAAQLPAVDPLSSWAPWTAVWFRFDTGWFVGVATGGYHWSSVHGPNTNFLPLYPLLIRLARPICLGSPWIAAWVVSNVAFLCALIALYRWATTMLDQERAAQIVLLVSAFPFAFFYFAPYSESLFLLLAVCSFLLAEEGKQRSAAALSALACLTRPVGVAVTAGLSLMYWWNRRRRAAAAVWLAVLPLAAFGWYVGSRSGHPLAFLYNHSQGWVRASGSPAHVLAAQFRTRLTPFDRIDAALALTFLASGILAWRRLGTGYGAYVIVGTLVPLAHGLVGMERYVTVLFPAMAAWVTLGGRAFNLALFSASCLLLVLFSILYTAGYTIT